MKLNVIYCVFGATILSEMQWLQVQTEFYTAITGQEMLLETQQNIIKGLETYIAKEDRRLQKIIIYQQWKVNVENMENPWLSFRLLNKLSNHLIRIEDEIFKGTEFEVNNTIILPNKVDLHGAVAGILRLQQSYKLHVTQLSKGNLRGIRSTPLNVHECYQIGKVTDKNRMNIKNSVKWLEEAYTKHTDADVTLYSLRKEDIIDNIITSHYAIGNYTSSLKWFNKLLSLVPRLKESSQYDKYRAALDDMKIRKESPPMIKYKKDRKDYDILCRNSFKLPKVINERLKCRYLFKTHPFLKIAPIKVEDLHFKPDLVIMYDVISDDEIEELKILGKPLMRRAKVQDSTGGGDGRAVEAFFRVNKLAWLFENSSEVVARVNRRVSHMTGLSHASTEHLQLANYGIGGQFEFHLDFVQNIKEHQTSGNRLATVLFYLSNVELGGATVFRHLGLYVKPIKGAALVWFNLHRSGEGDLDTEHGACPVLYGHKWIATKWFGQVGNELIRTCNLEQDH